MNSMNKLETIEDMYDEYEFFDDVLNKPLDKEEAIKGTPTGDRLLPSKKGVRESPKTLGSRPQDHINQMA